MAGRDVNISAPVYANSAPSWGWTHGLGVNRIGMERRTFKLPLGLPLSFDRAIEAGRESGRIALCNLLRPEVIARVRDALRAGLRSA